jgi:hypothetical protein
MNEDPKGLIREAYRIDGIGPHECRSILLDWALSVPADADYGALISELLRVYSDVQPEHPMTATLRDGLAPAAPPRRRGGRKGRAAS